MLPLLDDGADVPTVDPEFDDDELDDELEVTADDDVVVPDAVLEERPAYVCSARTPRPATASTALVTVERSTRVRRRSARSLRVTADVSRGLCDGGCERLLFMPSTVGPRLEIPMRAAWEPAGNRPRVQRASATSRSCSARDGHAAAARRACPSRRRGTEPAATMG